MWRNFLHSLINIFIYFYKYNINTYNYLPFLQQNIKFTFLTPFISLKIVIYSSITQPKEKRKKYFYCKCSQDRVYKVSQSLAEHKLKSHLPTLYSFFTICLLCGELQPRNRDGPHQRLCRHTERQIPTHTQKLKFYNKKLNHLFQKLFQLLNVQNSHDLLSIFEATDTLYPKEKKFNHYDFLEPPNEYLQQFSISQNLPIQSLKKILSPLNLFKVLIKHNQLDTNQIVDNRQNFIDELHMDITLENLATCIDHSQKNLEEAVTLTLPEQPNTQNQPLYLNLDIHIPEDYLPFDNNPFPIPGGDATPTYE